MDERRRSRLKLAAGLLILAVAGVVIALNSGMLGEPPADSRVVEAERRAEELAAQSRAAGFNDAPPGPAAKEKPEGTGRKPLSAGP